MSNNRKEMNSGQSPESSNSVNPSFNFDMWAYAVRQQMIAALKKRENARNS